MRMFMLLFLVSSLGLAELVPSKVVKTIAPVKSQSLTIDAHEVRGVDRSKLGLVMDADSGDESALHPMDSGDVNWNEKVRQSTEEMTQW